MRKCPIPVWVGRETNDRSGVAVAVGPFFDGLTHLDVTLMELASSLAALRGEHLHVIHAWRLDGESMLRSHRLSFDEQEVEQLLLQTRTEAKANVRELLAKVGVDQPYSVHLVKGRGEKVLPNALDGIRPGVLVMGTLARTGLRGMIIGNTAERVLARTDAWTRHIRFEIAEANAMSAVGSFGKM